MRATVGDRERFETVEERTARDPSSNARLPRRLPALVRRRLPGAVDHVRSEAEGRAGEAKPMPDDLVAGFGEWQLLVAEPKWFDVTDPWLVTPM